MSDHDVNHHRLDGYDDAMAGVVRWSAIEHASQLLWTTKGAASSMAYLTGYQMGLERIRELKVERVERWLG